MDAIREDLAWLGFGWDEESRQSAHETRFEKFLDVLAGQGQTYGCTCSRKLIQVDQGATESRYLGTCKNAGIAWSSGQGIGVRTILAPQMVCWNDMRLGDFTHNPQEQCGDILVRDRLDQWTYQFAVVVDDLVENVDLVIRGMDLLDSTARQIQLGQLLGRNSPPSYLHHPLLLDPNGNKLSKRQLSKSIRTERAEGVSANSLLGEVCFQGGLIPKPIQIEVPDLHTLF